MAAEILDAEFADLIGLVAEALINPGAAGGFHAGTGHKKRKKRKNQTKVLYAFSFVLGHSFLISQPKAR
ncbi:MAG TPA: hypothetical protein VIM71_05630 [Lacunisphaera sp.]